MKYWLVLVLAVVVSACAPATEEPPTPAPTATRPVIVPRNENVEALNAAQAAFKDIEFGFAPLLVDDAAQIILQSGVGVETPRLTYPQQPSNPTEWPVVDSFVSAYGVQYVLLHTPHVNRVALGRISLSASVDQEAETIEHFAAWITFTDRSRAIIDLSPLSTNFAPRHAPDRMLTDAAQIEEIFLDRRSGVNLDQLQPMTVVKRDGQVYYLLAKIAVSYDRYEFDLRTYPVEIADPMRPMNLRPGVSAGVEIERDEFDPLQKLLIDEGPAAFENNPDLLVRKGGANETLVEIQNEHLELLWHLITKFEHQLPDSSVPTATPTASPTPSPTATPTPTATPRKLPLVTS